MPIGPYKPIVGHNRTPFARDPLALSAESDVQYLAVDERFWDTFSGSAASDVDRWPRLAFNQPTKTGSALMTGDFTFSSVQRDDVGTWHWWAQAWNDGDALYHASSASGDSGWGAQADAGFPHNVNGPRVIPGAGLPGAGGAQWVASAQRKGALWVAVTLGTDATTWGSYTDILNQTNDSATSVDYVPQVRDYVVFCRPKGTYPSGLAIGGESFAAVAMVGALAHSRSLLSGWDRPQVVFHTDLEDSTPDEHHFVYSFPVRTHPSGVLIAAPALYSSATVESIYSEAAYSIDYGRTWRRINEQRGTPWVDLGAGGSFDDGMIFMTPDCHFVVGSVPGFDDEWWHFYDAWDGYHDEAPGVRNWGLGLAKGRSEGLWSWRVPDTASGFRTSREIVVPADASAVTVNAALPGADAKLRVYCYAADAMLGDDAPLLTGIVDAGVDATRWVVEWESGTIETYRGTAVRFLVLVVAGDTDADVYSMGFSTSAALPQDSISSGVWLRGDDAATAGGAFSSWSDRVSGSAVSEGAAGVSVVAADDDARAHLTTDGSGYLTCADLGAALSSVSAFSLFLVHKCETTTATQYLMFTDGAAGVNVRSNGDVRLNITGSDHITATLSNTVDGELYVTRIDYDSGSVSVWNQSGVDQTGSLSTSGAPGSTNAATDCGIFASDAGAAVVEDGGAIYELIVVPGTPDADLNAQIEKRLLGQYLS